MTNVNSKKRKLNSHVPPDSMRKHVRSFSFSLSSRSNNSVIEGREGTTKSFVRNYKISDTYTTNNSIERRVPIQMFTRLAEIVSQILIAKSFEISFRSELSPVTKEEIAHGD